MSYGFGTQGGQALNAPSYRKYQYKTIFTSATLNTNTPQTYPRVTGQQRIFMKYLTYTWSFAIDGGSNTVAPEVMPMFPNTSLTYNPSIDYLVDRDPPRGATVQVLPIPTGTTRINVFRVTETVTGSNFTFDLAYSPFASKVDPTVTLLAPQILAGDLEIDVVFFRSTPDLRSSGRLIAFGAPSYRVHDFLTPFLSTGVTNPLDTFTPLPFHRSNGQQEIVVSNTTTGAYFSFEIDYGIIGQAGGYLGLTSPTANALPTSPPENATIMSVPISETNDAALAHVSRYRVTANDGRVYMFTFDPDGYRQIPPTIQLVNPGPPFGAENIELHIYYKYFYTI